MDAKTFFAKPQVQVLLVRACGASGFIGAVTVWVCHHLGLPVPDITVEAMVISTAVPEAVEWYVAWYRNNPNNIIRRMMKQLNGVGITDETKAEVLMAAKSMPEVATVVVKDSANGAIGALARNTAHPDIVTETQNALDKKGTP